MVTLCVFFFFAYNVINQSLKYKMGKKFKYAIPAYCSTILSFN